MDDSRDNKKNRFSNTMAFMEEYLNNVLNDELPFHNEEKNKLTYEVCLYFPLPLSLHTSVFLLFPVITSFFSALSPGCELGQTFDLLRFLQFL